MEAKKTLIATRILKEVLDVMMLEAEIHIPKAWQAKQQSLKTWRRNHRIVKAYNHYRRNGPRFVERVLHRMIRRYIRATTWREPPAEITEVAEKARQAGLAAIEELKKTGRL